MFFIADGRVAPGQRQHTDSDQYVGEDDPSILEPLYKINFSGFLNQRFQKLVVVPLDEYYDLRKSLFELY